VKLGFIFCFFFNSTKRIFKSSFYYYISLARICVLFKNFLRYWNRMYCEIFLSYLDALLQDSQVSVYFLFALFPLFLRLFIDCFFRCWSHFTNYIESSVASRVLFFGDFDILQLQLLLSRSFCCLKYPIHHFENIFWHRLHLGILITVLRVRSVKIIIIYCLFDIKTHQIWCRITYYRLAQMLHAWIIIYFVCNLDWRCIYKWLLNLLYRWVLFPSFLYFLMFNVFTYSIHLHSFLHFLKRSLFFVAQKITAVFSNHWFLKLISLILIWNTLYFWNIWKIQRRLQ